jgi:Spy/CpxP family protein refolding chaperone
MEKGNRLLTIIIIVLLVLNLVVSGISLCGRYCNTHKQNMPKTCMHKQDMAKCKGDSTCCMMKEMKLSEDQMSKMETLKKEFHGQKESFEDTMEYMQGQLLQEIKNAKPDNEKIKAITDKTGLLCAAFKVQLADHMIKVKAILTPEQQVKFFEMAGKMGCCGKMEGKDNKCGGPAKCSDKPECKDKKKENCPEHEKRMLRRK